ncbi:hypothetical protein IKG02_02845, partial [Candidatus Saccharibacteria bacterium]|nr:hypothetical protein [Candidatus Saccharibacteria bacterium]
EPEPEPQQEVIQQKDAENQQRIVEEAEEHLAGDVERTEDVNEVEEYTEQEPEREAIDQQIVEEQNAEENVVVSNDENQFEMPEEVYRDENNDTGTPMIDETEEGRIEQEEANELENNQPDLTEEEQNQIIDDIMSEYLDRFGA